MAAVRQKDFSRLPEGHVFVMDISGSMEGSRLMAAKRELMQAIDSLPKDSAFNIVVFSNQAKIWRQTLVTATPDAKQATRYFIFSLQAGGHTAAYDALDAAFRFDAEAIYFLSDGAPNAGKISAPAAIVAAVTQVNRVRRISIYTIGIAPGPLGGPLDLFVKTLAQHNFGVYRRVEQ
jgi:Ca-activated chloride channel family protein